MRPLVGQVAEQQCREEERMTGKVPFAVELRKRGAGAASQVHHGAGVGGEAGVSL